MNNPLQSFYKSFYGNSFARFFRRIPEFDTPRIRKEFFVSNPLQLCFYINQFGAGYPCYISTYNYGHADNLKNRTTAHMPIDRVFFDFDVDNPKAKQIKDELFNIRIQGPENEIKKQELLIQRASELVISNKIAKTAIKQAKLFSKEFHKEFSTYPALFFSGFKGCHAYCFFEPITLVNPNKTITYFAKNVKGGLKLDTMDLSVNKDAVSRLSRVPYSAHNITGLSVIPFKISDSYSQIMEKAVNPQIEPFKCNEYCSSFGEHLINIDSIFDSYKPKKEKIGHYTKFNFTDHREFFKNILGEPVKKYNGYNMYNCPFSDHPDKKPSFKVTPKGYSCYGCGRWGNYWQFYKDYYGWDDDQVRYYLKNTKEM